MNQPTNHVRPKWTGVTYLCEVCGRISIHPQCQAECPKPVRRPRGGGK